MKKRILVVEDDPLLAKVLADNLTLSGFLAECIGDGHLVVDRIRTFCPDLVLLDVRLPGRSGFDLCAEIATSSRTPVIMVTAFDQKHDKLQGLASGADDYIVKPFDIDELLARVSAVLRRSRPGRRQHLQMGAVIVDLQTLTATAGSDPLHLTRREFELLAYLSDRADTVVDRIELLRNVWGYADDTTTRAVDFAIGRLRKKIEPDPHRPRYLKSVRGDGYSLMLDPAPEAEDRPPR